MLHIHPPLCICFFCWPIFNTHYDLCVFVEKFMIFSLFGWQKTNIHFFRFVFLADVFIAFISSSPNLCIGNWSNFNGVNTYHYRVFNISRMRKNKSEPHTHTHITHASPIWNHFSNLLCFFHKNRIQAAKLPNQSSRRS